MESRMFRKRDAARSTALILMLAGGTATAREAPVVGFTENPGWINVFWSHDHRGADGYVVLREDSPYTFNYTTDARTHVDRNLTPDTPYRYKVCAIYEEERECSEWREARTLKPDPAVVAAPNTPPQITRSEFYHEPDRIRIWWRKTADYDRVIVRWWAKQNPVPSQVDHDGPSDGSHEVTTVMPGTYVFVLKGCDIVLTGTSCGEWSEPYEAHTAQAGVARITCSPGTLSSGYPRLGANGRADYLFSSAAPGRTDVAGHCVSPEGVITATYVTEGIWNPNARPGAWDQSGANATESFRFSFDSRLSPQRSPRRPAGDGTVVSFLLRANCDRDPWVHADATCRRTGSNVPEDIRAKWPALLTEAFPHARNAIPEADRRAIIAKYRIANDRLEGSAAPNPATRRLEPVNRDAIQGQAQTTPAATAASRPAPGGAVQAQASESQATPARPAVGSTLLQRQAPAVISTAPTTTLNSNPTLSPAATAASSPAVQAASSPAALVLICRGGNLMSWTPYLEQGTQRRMVSLSFQPQMNRVSASGAELKPSECGFTTQSGYFPPNLRFESSNMQVREQLTNDTQYYSFDVVAGHGYYEAMAHRPLRTVTRSDARIQGTAPARAIKVERRPTEPQLQPVSPGARAPDLERDCTRNGPRISNLRGRITPGGSFTVNGACFGDRPGDVQLIGQFAGGTLRPAITRWGASAVVVQMPALPDTAGHVLSVSVRRAADGRTSPAVQGRLVPVMREVDVPPAAWSPNGQFTLSQNDTKVNTGVLDNVRTSDDARKLPRHKTTFRLAINASCELQTLEIPATTGAVHAVSGWDAGPPHLANVEVTWTPRCEVDSLEVPGLARDEWKCAAAFTLKARASCPAGVAPL